MSDQDSKSVDFNPLDILASAAATLKQVDKKSNLAMTQQRTQQRQSVTPAAEGRSNTNNKSDNLVITEGDKSSDKNTKNKDNNGVKKIRVVTTLSSDLEKMLDEHNYGNSHKNILGKSLTDVNLPGGSSGNSDTKDRKVVVTVINKTGDHHVFRTINNIKHQSTEGSSTDKDHSCDNTTATGNLPEASDICRVRCSTGEHIDQGVTENCTDSSVNINADNCYTASITQSTGSTNTGKSCSESDNENEHQMNEVIDTLPDQCDKCDENTPAENEECSENQSVLKICTCSDVTEENSDMCKKCNKKDDNRCPSVAPEKQDEKCDNKIDSLSVNLQPNEKSHIHVVSVVSKPDTLLSRPQTVVINISHNKDTVSTNLASPTAKGDNCDSGSCNKVEKQDTRESKNNIVRSLLTCEKEDVKCPENLSLQRSGLTIDKVHETLKGETSTCQQDKSDFASCSSETESKTAVINSDEDREITDCVLPHGESEAVVLKTESDNECEQTSVNAFSVKNKLQATPDISIADSSSLSCSDFEEGGNENGNICNQMSGKQKDFTNKLLEAETSNNKINAEQVNEDHVPSIDHCYAETVEPFQPQQQRYATRKSHRLHSTESLLSDLSQDSGFGDLGNSPGTPINFKNETQRQAYSSDINSTDNKQPVKVIASSPLLISSDDASSCSKISSLLEMGSSGISSLQDLNDVNKARDAIIALVQSSESLSTQNVMVTPVKSTGTPASNNISPKIGKYRIGTFASVSKSTFGLESPKKPQGIMDAQKLILTPKLGTPTSLLSKMNGTGKSVLPHIVSSQAGTSSAINMSEVVASNGKLPSSQTSNGSVNHVEHDHDYCLPAAAMSSSPHLMAKLLKDTVFLKQGHVKPAVVSRDKRSDSTDSYKRPRKVSVSTSDLSDFVDVPSPSSVISDSPLSPMESSSVPLPSMSTRQKTKSEKAAEYVRSGNSASKLKITGKFQDDYIYFLNTKVRSRRRTNSQDIPTPVPADRIIVPAPKPGDIVVPHLTDADLEAIKHGQHASVKPPSSLNLLGSISSASSVAKLQTLTSTASLITPNSVESMSSPTTATASGTISDEENKIINTILSMENCDSTTTGGTTVPELPDSSVVSAPPQPSSDSFGLNFIPEQLNLTNEQMEILYSAMDEVQSLSPDLTPSGDKFPIPADDDSTSEVNKEDKVLLDENLPESETKSPESSAKKSPVPSTDPAEDSTSPLAESAAVTTETVVAEDGKCLSETKDFEPLSGTSTIGTEASSVNEATTTNSLTVKSLLQSSSVKSLIQDAASISQNKSVNIENTATVRSLLQADRNTVKSLLTNSAEIRSNSVVNSMPDMPFTSLDKSSLDLFGNDLKLFPEASVTECRQQSGTTSVAMTTPPSTSTDHSAPWIVTVSMFWNDLPAIMINNLPFVRLVDIHKQILPAKDTGILKKRCQLLGINVANCTEMQRYFLVQYGKAFNSKSTLIVGKDDAKVLIGYYVNPVPKPPRGEDLRANEKNEEPRPVHTVASKVSRSSTGSKSKSQIADQRLSSVLATQELPAPVSSTPVDNKTEPPTVSTAPASPAIVPVVKSESSALTIGTAMSSIPPQETIQTPQGNQRISQRTRHKKINFLEMLKGDANNNTTNSAGSPDSVRTEVTEEKEIVPSLKMDVNENTNDVTKIPKKAPVKRKASPVLKTKDGALKSEKVKVRKVSEEIDSTASVNSCDSGHTEDPCTGESEAENKVHQDKYPFFVGKRGSRQNDREQMMKKLKTVKAKKPGSLKVKWTIFNKANSKKSGIFSNASSNNKSSGKLDTCRSEILAVIHKDMVSRNGDKRRMQAGNVFLDQYKGKDAACVRCCTCKKLFTVDMFLTHLHEIGGNGKLLVVSQPQTIALRDMYPTEIQKRMWQSFQKRRRALANVKSEDVKTVDTSAQDVLVENVQKVGHENFNGTEHVVKPNPVARARNSVPPITPSGSVSNRNVRISARKRKQKQLYPIENYSFARKVHQQQSRTIMTNIQIESDGDEPMSPLAHNDSDSCNGSPSKVQKIMSLSSEDELSLGDSVSTSVTSKVTPESVLTLTTSGPEVISFTALQQDEGLDI